MKNFTVEIPAFRRTDKHSLPALSAAPFTVFTPCSIVRVFWPNWTETQVYTHLVFLASRTRGVTALYVFSIMFLFVFARR